MFQVCLQLRAFALRFPQAFAQLALARLQGRDAIVGLGKRRLLFGQQPCRRMTLDALGFELLLHRFAIGNAGARRFQLGFQPGTRRGVVHRSARAPQHQHQQQGHCRHQQAGHHDQQGLCFHS